MSAASLIQAFYKLKRFSTRRKLAILQAEQDTSDFPARCDAWQDPARANGREIAELKLRGFRVEDMGEEYGASFVGQFRWINTRLGEFQDGEVSYSEAQAWIAAKVWAGVCLPFLSYEAANDPWATKAA